MSFIQDNRNEKRHVELMQIGNIWMELGLLTDVFRIQNAVGGCVMWV